MDDPKGYIDDVQDTSQDISDEEEDDHTVKNIEDTNSPIPPVW